MPINYVRRLTGRKRTTEANRHLGFALAFVAGATNAGGFLAVHQYTSHMTGIVSAMADNVALGEYGLVLTGAGALFSFLLGAACSAVMISFARRQQLHSEYALPLLFEALLLLCFGLLGTQLSKIEGLFIPLTVILLCYIMGLQNAITTKLSGAEIRTTHVTGIVTDIGIELGKLFYWNSKDTPEQAFVIADRTRLGMLTRLLLFFFCGGIVGAISFKYLGYLSTVPLAMILIILAIVPAADDVFHFIRRRKRK